MKSIGANGNIHSNRIVLIGGGGHCKSVIDSLCDSGKYSNTDIAIIDPKLQKGSVVHGCHVLGTDDDLKPLYNQGYKDAFITVGCIASAEKRRKLYSMAKRIGFSFITIVDKSTVIAEDVIVEEGAYVAKGAIINAGSRIGLCSIINTGAIIEHDCSIGTFSHVAVGAVICGGTEVGDDVLVGTNATIIQGVKIGNGCIVGAGSVILSSVPENTRAVGTWKNSERRRNLGDYLTLTERGYV